MRAKSAWIAGALILPAAALAHDAGQTVTFSGRSTARFSVQQAQDRGPRVVYDSGLSDDIAGEWDTVLIQGESADPAIVFSAAHAGGEDWKDLEMHRFADGRFWGKARMGKAAGALRLRARDSGARGGHDVTVYTTEVFVEETVDFGAPAALLNGPRHPDAPRPLIHKRSEWGAVAPKQLWLPDPLPWRVTIHHSEGRRTTTLKQSEAEARFIQNFHIHGRGWSDIAYHFLVDARGNILEGRPEGVLGAHTLGNNEGNVGIVLLGTYHPPVNDAPTKAQLDAVAALGRYLVSRYGIDPKSLRGHRDYKRGTVCPGDRAYAKLDILRLAFAGIPRPPAFRKPAAPLFWLKEPSFDGPRRVR